MNTPWIDKRIAIVMLALLPPAAWGQLDVRGAQDDLRTAGAAFRDGDTNAAVDALEAALQKNPHSLPTQYNLACAYALSGRHDDALEILQQLVNAQIDFGMRDDPDLESLRALPAFESLTAQVAASQHRASASSRAFVIDQLGVIPEGIAYDHETSRTFLGSMRSGDIFVFDQHGQLSKFGKIAHNGPLAAIGLRVDVARNLLWVVGSKFDLTESFDPEAPIESGIFGLDLATGEVRRQLLGDDPGFGFNDVALGPEGNLYVSGGVLSVADDESEKLEPIETSEALFGTNGLVVSPDGRKLIVASYPVGLALVDIATGATRWIQAPANVSLYGIDGLYWHGDDLIAVQNGARPWRIVRLRPSEDLTSIESVELVEFANPALTGMTGAVVDNEFLYVGAGPASDNPPSHMAPALARESGKTIVMRTPLN